MHNSPSRPTERGSAVVEMAFLGTLCFGLLIQMVVLFGQLQRAALATRAAARDAGRAVVLTGSDTQAAWRARAAAVTAARDHGLDDAAIDLRVEGQPARGALLQIEARTEVRVVGIPLLDRFLPGPTIPVIATQRVRVDRYGSAP